MSYAAVTRIIRENRPEMFAAETGYYRWLVAGNAQWHTVKDRREYLRQQGFQFGPDRLPLACIASMRFAESVAFLDRFAAISRQKDRSQS